MARLRQRDFAAFSDGLAALYADVDPDTLADRFLACLLGVFSCEFASFSLLDRRRARLQTSALSPAVSDWPGLETHQRHLRHDPAARYLLRTGDQRAVKISDFVSLPQYRNLSVYTEVFARVGCNRRMGFAVQGKAPVSLVATLNRSGRDFSEEERQMLDALRPHLLQANDQALAEQRRRSEQVRERENLGDLFGVGLAEIDASSRVLWSTQRARALCKDFFPVQGHASTAADLPEEIRSRVVASVRRAPFAADADAPVPTRLVWHFDGPDCRCLKVRLTPGTAPERWQLLFEETKGAVPAQTLGRALRLTDREAEVLYWVMQGKTNWEVGAILIISEKTVARHLENIFAKLHVENRTAAVRVALEASAGFLPAPARWA